MFIGYSLPPSDMHSTVLFRTSVKHGGLDCVVVVNPDSEARRRTREVLQRGIGDKTRVLSFDEFGEFANASPAPLSALSAGTKPRAKKTTTK